MTCAYRVAVIAVFGLASSLPAGARMGMRMPQFRGVWNPMVGSGAAYEVQHQGGQKGEIEIAIVAKESVSGKDGYWLEMSFQDPHGEGNVVVKSLIVLDGPSTEIKRMIMQMAAHPDRREGQNDRNARAV